MGLPVLACTFLLIFLTVRVWSKQNRPETMVRAILTFALFIALSTETLSLFECFSRKGLLWSYLVLDTVLIAGLSWQHEILRNRIREVRSSLQSYMNRDTRKSGILIPALFAGFIIVFFVQGIIYPPGNWDSMTYHLARIVHWLQNGDVNHYPTAIMRQLYQPPFAEYVIGHLCILSKNDLWANAVQLFFLVSTLFAIEGAARELGLNAGQRLLALFLVITIPEVVLQSSGTQNDIVVTFFIVSAVYHGMLCYKKGTPARYLFMALSVGLALLTKATAFLYLAPVLLVFGIAVTVRSLKVRSWQIIHVSFFLVAGVLLINGGFYYRNYRLSGNPLGTTGEEYRRYASEKHTAKALVSNVSRNLALHFGVPFFAIPAEKAVCRLHAWIWEDPDNPATTVGYVHGFRVNSFGTHEDYGANIIHVTLLLILPFMFLFFRESMRSRVFFYFLMIISGFLLFCYLLKWQPWHSRLHTPLFILAAPVLAYYLTVFIRRKSVLILLVCLMTLFTILVTIFNYSRPLYPIPPYTADIKITDGRYKKYFANRPRAYHDYNEISGYLKKKGYRTIGLKIDIDDWEYPVFRNVFKDPVRAIHLDVANISNTIPQTVGEVDCIVSTEKRKSMIRDGSKYRNFTPGNTLVFLYVR